MVSVAIQRRTVGRRVGNVRARGRSSLRWQPRCIRLVLIARLSRTARAGLNRMPFPGRVGGRALPLGVTGGPSSRARGGRLPGAG